MANVLVQESSLQAIASAIREKTGSYGAYKPREMAPAIRNLPGGATLQSLSVTENGTYTPESGVDGFSSVNVAVPGNFEASDEGKVVHNGALMPQTSLTVTANGTYDTTTKNRVVVNTIGDSGLPSGLLIGTTAPTPSIGSDGDTYWQYETLEASAASNGSCIVYGDHQIAYSWAMEIQFLLKAASANYERIACSAWSPGAGTGYFAIGFSNRENGALMAYWSTDNDSAVQSYISQNLTKQDFLSHPHTIRLDAGRVYEDGVLVHTFSGAPGSSTLGNYFDLFATKNAGSYEYSAQHAAIIYCKIWDDNGTLVQHFLPYNDNGTTKVRDDVTGTVYAPTGAALVYNKAHKHVNSEWKKTSTGWTRLPY